MRTIVLPISVSVLALGAVAPLITGGADQPDDRLERDCGHDIVEVQEFVNHYIDVLEGRDPERVRDLYVTDHRFAWFTDGERAYKSVDDLLASLAGLERAGMTLTTTLSATNVVVLAPALASVSTRFETTGWVEDGEFAFSGIITMLVERSESGWRVIRGHTSTPGGRPERSN